MSGFAEHCTLSTQGQSLVNSRRLIDLFKNKESIDQAVNRGKGHLTLQVYCSKVFKKVTDAVWGLFL